VYEYFIIKNILTLLIVRYNKYTKKPTEGNNSMTKLFAPLMAVALAAATPAMADIEYSSLPSPTTFSVASVAYEATSAAEFGQGVTLQGNCGAKLSWATAMMDQWAMESTDGPLGDSVRPLIATDTLNALILWQPQGSSSAACQALDSAYGYANQAWLELLLQAGANRYLQLSQHSRAK
jgi:hypothetical protein